MPAMPHTNELPAISDAVRPQHRCCFETTALQTRQCGSNALQALRVTPLQNARKAGLALPPPLALVFDQPTECSREALDVPGSRRVTVHAILDKIGHTPDLAGNHDRKAGAHGFVHGEPPGFVL